MLRQCHDSVVVRTSLLFEDIRSSVLMNGTDVLTWASPRKYSTASLMVLRGENASAKVLTPSSILIETSIISSKTSHPLPSNSFGAGPSFVRRSRSCHTLNDTKLRGNDPTVFQLAMGIDGTERAACCSTVLESGSVMIASFTKLTALSLLSLLLRVTLQESIPLDMW
jgi:hypothetical protein